MKWQSFLDKTQSRYVEWTLLALLALSIVAPFIALLFGENVLPSALISAAILLGLLTIVRVVGQVPEIRKDVSYLREVASVRVDRMPTVVDFYNELTDSVTRASASLDLTHIRDTPPRDFGSSAESFFAMLVDWCATEGRSIRRVICIRNPAMLEWAHKLAEQTKDLPQFSIRVIDWQIDAPAINLAIVDNKKTYIALTGATAMRTTGLAIEDADTTRCFTEYYNNLWTVGTDLEKWLSRDSRE